MTFLDMAGVRQSTVAFRTEQGPSYLFGEFWFEMDRVSADGESMRTSTTRKRCARSWILRCITRLSIDGALVWDLASRERGRCLETRRRALEPPCFGRGGLHAALFLEERVGQSHVFLPDPDRPQDHYVAPRGSRPWPGSTFDNRSLGKNYSTIRIGEVFPDAGPPAGASHRPALIWDHFRRKSFIS